MTCQSSQAQERSKKFRGLRKLKKCMFFYLFIYLFILLHFRPNVTLFSTVKVPTKMHLKKVDLLKLSAAYIY